MFSLPFKLNMLKKIFGILLILTIACQPDMPVQPFRTEFKVLNLEIALLQQDHGNIQLLAGEVKALLEDHITKSELEQQVKGDAIRLLDQIQTGYYNPNHFEELTLLKEDLLILFNSNEYKDNHLDALWHFGNALLTATSTARDPLMDLYEWNEFELQIQMLKDAWEIVEKQDPSMALLRYNSQKKDKRVELFDQLNIALQEFEKVVADGFSPTETLCEKADELRKHYLEYLELLTAVDSEDVRDEALK